MEVDRGDNIFDPYDMDREEFNTDLCLLRFSESCDLHQILCRLNNLDAEIRDLSGGVQNTLYDNYSKFIKISRVTSDIKRNFGKMSDDIDLLTARMGAVGTTSEAILKNLQPRRDRIAELVKSKASLNKLMDLIDLVPKLKDYLVNGDHVKAARHYLEAEKLLRKYRHLPSFQGITEDCRSLISEIVTKLKEKFDCSCYGSEEASESMELVLRLGEEAEAVLKDFFSVTNRSFVQFFTIMEGSWDAVPPDMQEKVTVYEFKAHRLCSVSLDYIDLLSNAVTVVRNVFLRRNSVQTPFCAVSVLGEFMSVSMEGLFEKLRIKFREIFSELTDSFFADILDRLYRKWHDCCLLVPDTEIAKQNTRIFLDVCKDRCDYIRRKSESEFRTCVDELLTRIAGKVSSLDKQLALFGAAVDGIFSSILNSLSPYIEPGHMYSRNIHFRKVFCKALVRESVVVALMIFINQELYTLRIDVKSSKHDPAAVRMHLLLSTYAWELGRGKLEKHLSATDDRFHSSSTNLIITPVSEIEKDSRVVSRKMLDDYVRVYHRTLSAMFQKSMENNKWSESKEPWKVSSFVRRIVEEFDVAVRDVESLLGARKPSTSSKSNHSNSCLSIVSRSSSPSQDSANDRVFSRIHKLFSPPPRYFERVEFSSDSVLSCIMESSLKCFQEYVRQKTFSCCGLQQMQVDLHYLENRILPNLIDEEHFVSLFDDVVSSCYHRTVEPELLNYHVIAAICQSS